MKVKLTDLKAESKLIRDKIAETGCGADFLEDASKRASLLEELLAVGSQPVRKKSKPSKVPLVVSLLLTLEMTMKVAISPE
jgi:hypothetical protein